MLTPLSDITVIFAVPAFAPAVIVPYSSTFATDSLEDLNVHGSLAAVSLSAGVYITPSLASHTIILYSPFTGISHFVMVSVLLSSFAKTICLY